MFFFFKQKTAYEMRISDWSSDVCSSDLLEVLVRSARPPEPGVVGDVQQPLRPGTVVARGPAREDCLVADERLERRHARQDHCLRPSTRGEVAAAFRELLERQEGDRTSVGEGKRVSVRVDMGGSRIIKKKKKNDN